MQQVNRERVGEIPKSKLFHQKLCIRWKLVAMNTQDVAKPILISKMRIVNI